MTRSSKFRNWIVLLSIPIAFAIGLAIPGNPRERFLQGLLTLSIYIAGIGARILFDAIQKRKARREIGLAIGYVVLGLAGAFNALHELTNEFVPGMWIFPVAVVVFAIASRLAYPHGITTQDDKTH